MNKKYFFTIEDVAISEFVPDSQPSEMTGYVHPAHIEVWLKTNMQISIYKTEPEFSRIMEMLKLDEAA